jgi:peptidoglycan/xylan/chitin deacetylase (PgdA/CDA1 family)
LVEWPIHFLHERRERSLSALRTSVRPSEFSCLTLSSITFTSSDIPIPVKPRLWKSTAKDAFFFVYLNCGYLWIRDLILSWMGRSRAVVLYYHRIGGRSVLSKSVEQFQDDIRYLSTRYECLTLIELCERLRHGKRFERPIAVVTFDDGYRDNFVNAVPVLREFGVTASFFVSTAYIDSFDEFPHDRELFGPDCTYPKLTWEDLEQMQQLGFEIGSHTVTHADMSLADEATARVEMQSSLDVLNAGLGSRPRCFTFPWGKPKRLSDMLVQQLQQSGYLGSAGASGGCNTFRTNPFEIQRVDLGNGSLSHLGSRAKIAGLNLKFWHKLSGGRASA